MERATNVVCLWPLCSGLCKLHHHMSMETRCPYHDQLTESRNAVRNLPRNAEANSGARDGVDNVVVADALLATPAANLTENQI